MNEFPLVTVFTLIFNTDPRYVIEAIESVRANNYPNIQHIIIDDCSPNPEPIRIVKEWVKSENYICEVYEHEVNFGICRTMNHVLELAKGEFVLGCSDDILEVNRISTDVLMLCDNKNAAIIFGKCKYIDHNGMLIETQDIGNSIIKKLENLPYSLLKDNFIITPSVTYRKSALNAIGGFSTEYLFEDYPSWLEFVRLKYDIMFRNDFSVFYRIHSSSFCGSNQALVMVEDMKIKMKYFQAFKLLDRNFIRQHACEILLMHPETYSEVFSLYSNLFKYPFDKLLLYLHAHDPFNYCILIIKRIKEKCRDLTSRILNN